MEQSLFEKAKWAGIFWLARRLPDCKALAPKFGESLDRKLPFRERLTAKLHLMICDACQRYLEQITFIKEAVSLSECRLETGHGTGSPGLSAEAKLRLKARLRPKGEAA